MSCKKFGMVLKSFHFLSAKVIYYFIWVKYGKFFLRFSHCTVLPLIAKGQEMR